MFAESKVVPVLLTDAMRKATSGASSFDEAWKLALEAAPRAPVATHRHKRTGFGYRQVGGWQVFNGSYWVRVELENPETELEPLASLPSEGPIEFAILVSVHGPSPRDYKVSCIAEHDVDWLIRREVHGGAIMLMVAYSVSELERRVCRNVYEKCASAESFIREMNDGYGASFQLINMQR